MMLTDKMHAIAIGMTTMYVSSRRGCALLNWLFCSVRYGTLYSLGGTTIKRRELSNCCDPLVCALPPQPLVADAYVVGNA
jgi:hypothetical protein